MAAMATPICSSDTITLSCARFPQNSVTTRICNFGGQTRGITGSLAPRTRSVSSALHARWPPSAPTQLGERQLKGAGGLQQLSHTTMSRSLTASASGGTRTGADGKENTDEILERHARGAGLGGTSAVSREEHNESQARFFDDTSDYFQQEVPEDILKKLGKIVAAASLGPGSRVLDVGAGTGALVPPLLAVGVEDVVAADLSAGQLAVLKDRFDCVQCWQGDVCDALAAGLGPPFDAVFFNAVFGNLHDQREGLRAAAAVAKKGSRIVISHPLGRAFVERLRTASPDLVLHALPDRAGLESLVEGTGVPLAVAAFTDTDDFYLAVLEVTADPPPFTATGRGVPSTSESSWEDAAVSGPAFFPQAPLYLKARVTTGFGRGSKQLGVPTANLPPEELGDALIGVSRGVYFGWAQLRASGMDNSVHKMVMNVGKRPTFADGDGITVEVHVLHDYGADFYGEEMRVVALGFIREELKFKSVDELLQRIRLDISIAANEVDAANYQKFRDLPFFSN